MNAVLPLAQALPWVPATSSEVDLKLKFARLIYKLPDNPENLFAAARQLFPMPEQMGLAATVARDWPYDPVCKGELIRLGSAGEDEDLPTKADIGRRLMVIADNKDIGVRERLVALDKYSELMGMKPVPGSGGTVNIDQTRVFVLPQPAPSLEEWERGAKAQQAKLIEGNARRG